MHQIATASAERLQTSDPYTDRTGDLRKSTRATLDLNDNTAVVTLEMDTPYASFVAARGYSEIEREALIATLAIRRLIDGLGREIFVAGWV